MSTDPRDAAARENRLLETLERLSALDITEVPALITAATQLIAHAMGADQVEVFLPDPPTGELVAMTAGDTPLGRQQRALGLHRLPVAQGGRVVHVYTTATPFRTGRADQDPWEHPDIPRDLGVRSLLAAPLHGSGSPRGVLAVASAQPDRFSATDLRFLIIVAHWLNVVTEHAALLRRLEDLSPAAPVTPDLDQTAAPDRLVHWQLDQLEEMAEHTEATVAVVQATLSLNESKVAQVQEAVTALQGQVADLRGALAHRDDALRAAAARQDELAEQLRQARATIARLESQAPA